MGSRPSAFLQALCSLDQHTPESPPPSGVVGVLLCAGWARCRGNDTLCQTLPDGRTVAQRAAWHLEQGGCDRVVAVLRPPQQALAHALMQHGIGIVWSDAAAFGLGHSLAAGVQATAGALGWVAALGDMPMVQPASIAHVVMGLRRGSDIVGLYHQGQRGHPIGWGARWGAQLAELAGDDGARQLLGANPDRIDRVDVNDPGILYDIDTPGALNSLWAHWPDVPPTQEVIAEDQLPPLSDAA